MTSGINHRPSRYDRGMTERWSSSCQLLLRDFDSGVAYADAFRKQSLHSANTDSGYVLTIPKRGSSTWYTDRFRSLQTAVNFLPNAPSLGNGMVRPNFLA